MKRELSRLPLLVLLAASVATLGCYETESRVVETIDQTWEVSDLESLDLESVNGRIEVRAGDPGQVRVRAEVRSSQRVDGEIVRFDASGRVLEVREKWPRKKAGIFPFHHGSGGSVRYEIDVPEEFVLELETTNGRIETHGVRGQQSVASVNGRIEIATPSAPVSATTVNGRIEARFSEEFRGAKLRTVNGSVRIYVPAGTRVAADVDQVNGSFNSRLPVVVNARGAEGVPLKVTTVNGSVTLDEIAAHVDEESAEADGQEL